MNASELFKAGKLPEAIDAQLQEVKKAPADHGKRLFLFELLAFAGDLDRARKQIDVIQYGEAERDAATLAYRKALDADQTRRRLFSEGLAPEFLAPPPDHVKLRLDAVNRLREGNRTEAAATLVKAHEATPEVQGILNDKPFASLRDCDDLFSGILEVMSQGKYFWLPFEQIDTLVLKAPKFPRDLLYVAGKLQVLDGPAGDVFIPALYLGTHEHPDNAVRLGRSTDWKGVEGEPVLGVGQRMFLVDDNDMSLLEWRDLEVGTPT